ncbi:tetratricopeptide repeat protein [uncultured Pseudacidovorax sp.]|uniref:tetratricopeptide repeat protein n=1 Tax=uncultured Pseudacidovorax sp. TaxID=679313 RepID=UPI0025EAD6C8|nr:tetratricopeptide repeat protein [uncultured Pseudacidovorax sp.]
MPWRGLLRGHSIRAALNALGDGEARGRAGAVLSRLGPILLCVGLAACSGTPKSQYPGAEAAQERQSTQAAADAATGADGSAAIDSAGTYLRLVARMQQDGLWFASLAHVDALEARHGVLPASTRLRADALRQTGQDAASAAAYRRLVGTPLEAAGYHGLGLLAGGRGDFAEAARLMAQARRSTPTDGLLLSDLGYALLRAGRTDDARVPLMQAAQLRPDQPQVQANLALYLQASGRTDQATALMDAQRLPDASRAAIRQAARELAGGVAPTPAAELPAGFSPGGLALRTATRASLPRSAAAAADASAEAAPTAPLIGRTP